MAATKQEANVSLVLCVGIVAGILVLVIVIGVQAWYTSAEEAEADVKADQYPNQTLLDLKNAQLDKISDFDLTRRIGSSPDELKAIAATQPVYHWVDKKNNVVAIPIQEAMDIYVKTEGKPPATQPSGQ